MELLFFTIEISYYFSELPTSFYLAYKIVCVMILSQFVHKDSSRVVVVQHPVHIVVHLSGDSRPDLQGASREQHDYCYMAVIKTEFQAQKLQGFCDLKV